MRTPMIPAVVVSITALAVPAQALAQDQQIGQQGAVWNLGELAPRTYPSTVTAVNKSCPGANDFHVSLRGEATEFLIITGPTILTDIPPGESKTSDVLFDLRTTAPGPHNEGEIVIRCVDCPFTCSQNYDVLAIHLTVLGDANAPPPVDASGTGTDSLWTMIDLTLLDPTMLPSSGQNSTTLGGPDSGLRWIKQDALASTTLVREAIASGMAALSFAGTGVAAGDIFTITITRSTPTPFEMGFPFGTLFQPDDPLFSPMILADNGAVALLDEITVITVNGYSLNPTLEMPPTVEQINGGSAAPDWSVVSLPDSGQFNDAALIINAAYTLAGTFSPPMPSDKYLRTATQRAIWFAADPESYGKDKLEQDVVAQVEVTGGSQTDEEIEGLTENLWADVTKIINLGKSE